MKKLVFTLALAIGAFTFVAAQADAPAKKSCSKPCSKTCTKTVANAATDTDVAAAAAKLAAMDESIEAKVDTKTGEVSYFRIMTCPMSGATATSPVKYCTEAKAFVDVAPSKAAAKAKQVSLETPAKKACCEAKACFKKKANAASANTKVQRASIPATADAAPNVKLVSSGL